MVMKNIPARAHFEAAPRVTARVRSLAVQTLNEHELRAIYSLFAWVAAEQDTAPETVRQLTEAHFETDHVTGLPRKQYDEVVRFLMDLRINEI